MTHRNIVIGLLVLLISPLALASNRWLESHPKTQKAIKDGSVVYYFGGITISNTGIGAMVYSYKDRDSKCSILLDRTDFENVKKNGLKIEKEQVMGFSCHPE